MKKIIMGIGISGAGKSTILHAFAEKNKYEYVCPDDIREEMTGDAANQSKNKEVWVEAYRRVQEHLLRGETVVFDATFTYADQRKDFINFVRKNGAEKVQGVYVDVDLEIAKHRNSMRDRKVPEYVLWRMDENLHQFPPNTTEGFDSIIRLDEEQKLIDAEIHKETGVVYKEFGSLK